MIPKKIHYIWFGRGEKSELINKCIASWKKFCPDYEIIEWNEDNFDVNSNEFIKEAYNHKKWAFAADVTRLIIIYENGGIYLDTDVELLKSLDELLNEKAFMAFEDSNYVNTGLCFGAEKGNSIIKENIEKYNEIKFSSNNEYLKDITCPKITTNLLKKYGLKTKNELQVVKDVKIFPSEYFCPYSASTGITNVTNNTYSIHHYNASWLNGFQKKLQLKKRELISIYGDKVGEEEYSKWYKKHSLYINLRLLGPWGFIKKVIGKLKDK